jgi:hypothetical protein
MKNPIHAILALFFLAGCSPSAQQVPLPDPEITTTQDAPAQDATTGIPEAKSTPPTLDAAELLNTALVNARAQDKRVMVHLGAMW